MKGKKLTGSLLVALLIFGIVTVSLSADLQQPKLFVNPPTYTAAVLGEVFNIDINIANVTGLAGFEFKLGYNTSLLDALDVVVGTFPLNPAFTAEINETGGYVWVYAECDPVNGNGTLATITFKTTYAGSVSSTLDLYDTVLSDAGANSIPHQVEDGIYKFVILGITVATDNPSYTQGKNVTIHGNLTLDGSPYEGLVGLEVDDPSNNPLVVRTVQTGNTTPPEDITILDVVPCNYWGNPKSSFKRNPASQADLFYVNVTVKNNSPTETKPVTITANTYDGNMVPLSVGAAQTSSLGPGLTWSSVINVPIPQWASLGTAVVFANAFTNWPGYGISGDRPLNGTPHCLEKNATFEIINSPPGATAALETQSSGNAGNYSLTFKLRVTDLTAGNYTIYATSSYQGQQVINTTTFEVKLLGDVDDNGIVNILDVKMTKLAFSGFILPPDPVWYRAAALAPPDNVVNILDVKIVKLIFSGIIP